MSIRSPRPGGWLRRGPQIAVSVGLVVAIFVGILPRIADYDEVWVQIRRMTVLEFTTLILAAAWNIVTYWLVMMAVLPGLGWHQAMIVNQSSTAISNTLPVVGGATGVAVTYAMYTSWGFSRTQIALSVLVSGVWNNFVKLGMPVLALALVALQGGADAARLLTAISGIGLLVLAVGMFALMLRSSAFARRVGAILGGWAGRVLSLVHRPPPSDWGEAAVRFRTGTIDLLAGRWVWLTLATLVSHMSLYLVLLVALRHVGVSEDEVPWAEVLMSFALIRLVQLAPLTPGGLGAVELGYTAALVAAGGDEAQVVASVLVFRTLTYLLPIPVGALTYVLWSRRPAAKRARRAVARRDEKVVASLAREEAVQ